MLTDFDALWGSLQLTAEKIERGTTECGLCSNISNTEQRHNVLPLSQK